MRTYVNVGQILESYLDSFNEEMNQGLPSTVPLGEYSVCARHQNDLESEETEYGEWCSPLWRFVRWMKGHPDLIGRSADIALDRIEGSLQKILPASRHPLTNGLYLDDLDMVEFADSWNKVRYTPGQEPLDVAMAQAEKNPLRPRNGQRAELYCRFVSLAGWLQVAMGNHSIFLPVELVGSYLNCDPATVSRLRSMAEREGILIKLREHKYRPGGKGRATEFIFDTSAFSELSR